jgi:TfoX/Sxy family transcriptional regulator of competence genes
VAYDAELTDRVRELLLFEPDVIEKRMFGGIAFLIGGHIAVAVSSGGGLLLRAEPDEVEALLTEPYVEPFMMRGRALRGWVRVAEDGVATAENLKRWVWDGVELARTLPPTE